MTFILVGKRHQRDLLRKHHFIADVTQCPRLAPFPVPIGADTTHYAVALLPGAARLAW